MFVDYKNAYNTILWEHLFRVLDQVFDPLEATFLKALYHHTSLKIGKETIHPNSGLMQGSTLSPLLFNFCIDHILRAIASQLNMSIEQILGFADDLSFLCTSIDQLNHVLEFLERESPKVGLIINKKKSAILEVCCRKYARPKWNLQLGEEFKGIPIVKEYPYLGNPVNRRLDAETSFNKIKLSTMHIIRQLTPLLSKSSIDFKVNIWKTFVSPILEMGAIPYIFSNKKVAIKNVNDFINKTIKLCLGFPRKGEDKYLNYLFPNSWHDRCLFIKRRSEIKWRIRKGETDLKIPVMAKKNQIDLKCLPNSFMTLIKLFGSKCKYCNLYRVNPSHLISKHKVDIQPFSIESVYSEWKEAKKKWKGLKRDLIIERGDALIKNKIKLFRAHVAARESP